MKTYPQHTKISAIALTYQGMSPEDIAQRLNISPEDEYQIQSWNKDPELNQLATQVNALDTLRDQVKHKLLRNANLFTDLALDPEKLKKSTTLQLMTSAKLAIQGILEIENKNNPQQSLQQININIDNTKQSIDTLADEEKALRAELDYLEGLVSTSTKSQATEDIMTLCGDLLKEL